MAKQYTCPHCKQQHGMEPREIARECPSVRRVEYNGAGAVSAIEYTTVSDYLAPIIPSNPPLQPVPPVSVNNPYPEVIKIDLPPNWKPPMYGGEGTRTYSNRTTSVLPRGRRWV